MCGLPQFTDDLRLLAEAKGGGPATASAGGVRHCMLLAETSGGGLCLSVQI